MVNNPFRNGEKDFFVTNFVLRNSPFCESKRGFFMKKCWIFILLILTAFWVGGGELLFKTQGEYVIYRGKGGSDAQMIFALNEKDARDIKRKTTLYFGESVSFEGNRELAYYFVRLYGGKLVKKEIFDGIESYYYYSDEIDLYQLVDGEKVNVHVVFNGERTSVGCPLIYGGY